MEKIENKKKIIIVSIAVTLILAIAISFGYLGIFNIDLNNVMNVNITANKIDNAVLDTTTTNFSITVDPYNMTEETSTTYIATNTSTLNVSLDANTTKTGVTCTYDIIFNYDSSSDKYTTKTAGTFKEFTLQVIGPEVGNNEFMSEDDFPSKNMTVVKNAKISNSKKGSPSVHNWTINTKFYNLAFDQSNLINKTYSGTFKVANVTCYQTEANNQININVTSLPYNNPNSNYSLSNLNGITSSNIEWNNINRMISIKNGVDDKKSISVKFSKLACFMFLAIMSFFSIHSWLFFKAFIFNNIKCSRLYCSLNMCLKYSFIFSSLFISNPFFWKDILSQKNLRCNS